MDCSRRKFLASMVGFSVSSVADPSPLEKLLSLLSRINPQSFSENYESLSIDSLLDGSGGNSLGSRKNHQILFLTFDDGPQPCTSKILKALTSTRHRATFFVIGRNLTNPPLREIAIEALRQGHQIGNHSYSHPDFSTISVKRAEREIIETHGLILDLYADAGMELSTKKLFFRFPYGVTGSSSNIKTCKKTLAELNYCIANWDLDTNDWQIEFAGVRFGQSRLATVIRRAKTQDVVLLHDRNQTAILLPSMLTALDYKSLLSFPLSWYPTEKILRA
jgi:peptidoglycan/xylan/chitin deacetylase (PgdA/CDA1 family)